MRRLGQSLEARLARLAEGRCPVHGHPMKPVGEVDGLLVVRCPRVRCHVTGVQKPPGRAVRLAAQQQQMLLAA